MKHRGFLDLFPPPKFLEMSPMGLSFTESAIHVIQFDRSSNGLVLGKFGTRPLPIGTITEGYVSNKDGVISALRELKDELGIEFVRASLPEEKAYLFNITVPLVTPNEIRQTIELRLEENVPVSARDAVFDYSVISTNTSKKEVDVSVSVLPTKVVDTYLEILKGAGLRPMAFEIEAQAVARSVVKKGDDATYMIVNIGTIRTNLSVVSRGIVQFTLSVPIGGDDITVAISKHADVSLTEARKIKEERGFIKNRENFELFLSLANTLSTLKDEIRKLLTYWQTHQGAGTDVGKFSKIILIGRDASLAGFDDYLSTALKIPTVVGDVWSNVFSYEEYVPTIPRVDSLEYASAIGLALPHKI